MPFSPRTSSALAALCMFLAFAPAVSARGDAPADPLLKLVPPDAAVTFVVEDLRKQTQAFVATPLYAGLVALPVVKDCLASDGFRRLEGAVKRAELILGENVATVRDDLLGEAVVLTLRLPPGGRPEEARGLLLIRVPDRALLARLVDGLNAAQLKSGELVRLSARARGGTAYQVREFRPGRKEDEYFASLSDRVFAWSNSEELIQGVIDRQNTGAEGLAGQAEFRKIRSRLPGRPLASVYVDPRFLERLVAASPKPQKPGEKEVFDLLGRYLASVRYVGAALENRDGLVLHSEEAVDPKSFDPSLKRWASSRERPDSSFRRVPATALAMATAHIDFGAILEGLDRIIPGRDRPKVENARIALSGLLRGLDVRSQVAPHLGPGVLFYLEKPGANPGVGRLPWVLSIEVGKSEEGAKVAVAIDNALRTALAIYALDNKHGGGRLRVETKAVGGGSTVTSLSAPTPFAYALAGGRLVLATTPEAVSRALEASSDPHGGDRVERVRSTYFPDALSFFLADLRALEKVAGANRLALGRRLAARQNRPEAEAARDLDQALALLGLFDVAYLTTSVSPDFSGVHHDFGFVRLVPPKP